MILHKYFFGFGQSEVKLAQQSRPKLEYDWLIYKLGEDKSFGILSIKRP